MKHLKAYSTVASFIRVALISLAGWCLVSRALAESVTLAWDPSPDPVQRYVVHQGTASRAYGSTTNAGTARTLTVQGLSPGQTYYFAVTAIGTNALESDFSNEVSYSVPNPNNTAPTITAIGNQTINEDGTAGPVSFTVGDAETPAGSLTVTGASSNTGLVPNGNIAFGGSGGSRTVTVRPAANAFGSAQITVTVSDGTLSASRTFGLTVNPVNDSPTISAIADQGIPVDGMAGPLSFTIGDVETSASSLVLAGSSSNPGLVPAANITFSGSGATRTLSVRPAAGQSGSTEVTVSVSDGSQAASTSFTVLVGGIVAEGDDAFRTLPLPTAQSNFFAATFDATPSASAMDAVVGLALGVPTGYGGLAAIVRFNDAGELDVRDGGTYAADATVAYVAGQTYRFRLAVDVVSHTYSVFVTPPGGSELTLAADFAFRTEQAAVSRLDTWVVAVASTPANTSLVVGNFSLQTAVNTAPTLAAISDRVVNEDTSTGAIGFTVDDAETAAGSLTLTRSSSNTSLVPTANVVLGGSGANRTVTVTPAADQSGTAQITLTVSDGSLTASRTFTVTVNAVNDAPTLASIANVAATAGAGSQTVSLSGIGTGAANENQTITVTATSANPAVVPNPTVTYASPASTGTLQYIPQAAGSALVTVTVQDNGGTANGGVNLVQRTFTVNVTSPGNSSAPTITSIANQTINEDAVAGPLAFTIGDAQTPADSLILTQSSSNTGLVPNANIVLGGSGANRTVTVTPAANQSGSAQITLTVSDGSLTASRTFSLTVNSVNDRPTVNTPANIAVTPVPQALGLGLAALGAGATVWDIGSGYLAQEQVVSVTGIGSGGEGSQVLTVTAVSSNPALVPHPTVDYTSPSSTASLRFTPSSTPGTAQITVTVRDSGGTANGGVDTTTAVFSTTVNAPANTPPTLAALAERTMNEDSILGPLSVAVSDAQTSAGSLTVTAASQNSSVIANSGLQLAGSGGARSLTIRPASNRYGKSLVTVQVTDAQGASASRAFWINVLPVNDAPLLDAIANVLLDGQSPVETVSLTGIAAGPFEATQTLLVQASSSNPGLIPHPEVAYRSADATAQLQLVPVAGASGNATITVTVRDDGGTASGGVNLVTRSFTVSGSAPLAAAPLPQQIVEATAAAVLSLPLPKLQIAVADATATITWDAGSGPATLQRNSSPGVGGEWSAVTEAVQQRDGQNLVRVAVKPGTEFFRLVRP